MIGGAVFALEVPYWATAIIKMGVIALVIPTAALVLGYVFLLKIMSFMQSRLGPMEAGPYGTLQLLADGVKFLQKEDIFPEKADRTVFALAPLVVLISTFLIYVVIPTGPDAVVAQLDVGIFYALAVSSLSVVGILMAGWASANKYALMGGLRAAGQLIAYELPLVLAVMGVVIQAGTLDLQKIVTRPGHRGDLRLGAASATRSSLTQFVGFFIFLVAVQAELTQPPFDMPVAESEIVGGYQVEYTGFRFLFFFMGEFGHRLRPSPRWPRSCSWGAGPCRGATWITGRSTSPARSFCCEGAGRGRADLLGGVPLHPIRGCERTSSNA